MRFTDLSTDKAVLEELGGRLRRTRLERNVSQTQLADEAGVSRFTVKRIEQGESVQLANLLRVLRFLGLLGGLEELAPEPTPSPIDALRHRGRERQRASSPRSAEPQPPGRLTWRWGDEEPEDRS